MPGIDWPLTVARRIEWPRTARARSTAAATAVVAVALVVAGVTALGLLNRSMTNAIDASLTARVNDLNALILDGSVPTLLTAPGDDEALVQIVDGDGTVLAASPNIDGEGPQPGLQTVTSRALPIGEGRFRLIARSVPAHGRTFTVYAASSLEPVTDAVSTLSAILVVGLPPLIAFVGATVWFIVGATLHPVEAIRNQVDSIHHTIICAENIALRIVDIFRIFIESETTAGTQS